VSWIQNHLVSLPRWMKRLILLSMDIVLLVAALWLSFSLRLGVWYWPPGGSENSIFWLSLFSPVVAIPIFIRFGLYRAIVRYLGMSAAWSVTQAVALYAVLWGLLVLLSGVPGIPRSVVLINAMVALLAVGGSRVLMRWLLHQSQYRDVEQSSNSITRVVIFGAGDAGRQLAVGLLHSHEYHLCGFVDDAIELQGRELMGVPVLSIDQLSPLIAKCRVSELFLAIPSISRKERTRIIEQLRVMPLRIRTLPGLMDLAKGKIGLSNLNELDVNDLLGREPAEPDEVLLRSQVEGSCVAITGAGGSIGAEISRQV